MQQKVALVTGASRGIGREIAVELAKQDFTVIVNYSGNEAAAKEVEDQIHALGKQAVTFRCNVANYDDVSNMIAKIQDEFGGIDVIINNAGITKDNLLLKMTEQEYDAVLDTNLKGAFNVVKHAVRGMIKKRSGRIINISSVSGVMGNAGQVNYSAAKAGMIGMTKALARELASRGITVNAVAPGFIDTDMTKGLPQATLEAVAAQIPLKRLGSVKDIADIVVFLATNEGNYITGQVFQVDGGLAI